MKTLLELIDVSNEPNILMTENRGGARTGAGRKPKENPLVTKCFRVDETAFNIAQEKHGKKLSGKVNDFIKRIGKK